MPSNLCPPNKTCATPSMPSTMVNPRAGFATSESAPTTAKVSASFQAEHRTAPKQRDAKDAFHRRNDLRQVIVRVHEFILRHINTVAGQKLVIRHRVTALG